MKCLKWFTCNSCFVCLFDLLSILEKWRLSTTWDGEPFRTSSSVLIPAALWGDCQPTVTSQHPQIPSVCTYPVQLLQEPLIRLSSLCFPCCFVYKELTLKCNITKSKVPVSTNWWPGKVKPIAYRTDRRYGWFLVKIFPNCQCANTQQSGTEEDSETGIIGTHGR